MSILDLEDRVLKKLWSTGFDSLSEPERVVATIWGLEADVNNGGFHQYFFNSYGDLAFFAPAALRLIGAHHAAEIVERANQLFGPEGPPRDRKPRQGMLLNELRNRAEELLSSLDDEFYKYPENIGALLESYARKEIDFFNS